MINNSNCCQPQDLVMDNRTGVLSITDGNSVYLGTIIRALGITTPVIDFRLSGFFIILTYTAADGTIQSKAVDLSLFVAGGTLIPVNTVTVNTSIFGGNIQADANISIVSGNALTTQVDGLYVPTFTESLINTTNSSTLNLVASGTNNHDLTGSVPISADAGNQLSVHGDGLFVNDTTSYVIAGTNVTVTGAGTIGNPYIVSAAATTNVPLQVVDSSTLHLATSGTAGHTLTGNAKISAALGNALVANGDGLYVPTVSGSTYTDAQARAAISALSPLVYNSATGVMSITQATNLANGYLTSTDWNIFNNKVTTGSDISSGSAVPVYAGNSGNILQFYGIRAGLNTTVNLVGNDIVISSTAPAPPASSVFNFDFVIGDGGAMTPAPGASTFGPVGGPLIGKTVLAFSVEGIQIAGVPRTAGQEYYSFDSPTGVITLFNGLFAADTYYSILYK